MSVDASVVARFLRFVPVLDESVCWEWMGSRSKGYGQLARGAKKPPFKAHRLAYEIFKGVAPGPRGVLHRCDNPACVNPNHLELGDQRKNMRDAAARGRLNPRSLENLKPGAPGCIGARPITESECRAE